MRLKLFDQIAEILDDLFPSVVFVPLSESWPAATIQ